MVWRWRNVHDLWIDVHGLRRPARCEYVRSRPEAARLARGCDEDTRSQGETGEEREEHHQSGCKAPEELPPQTEKRFWKSIPELPDAAECLPRRVKARSVCFNRTLSEPWA